MDVFEKALEENVTVLPGSPFFIDGGGANTMRPNFSNSTDEKIITGIGRLIKVIRRLCSPIHYKPVIRACSTGVVPSNVEVFR